MTNLDARLKQLVDESVIYGIETADEAPTKEIMADTDNFIGETVQDIYKAFIDAGWRLMPPSPKTTYTVGPNAKKV